MDADARRTRAVNRLAKWSGRRDRNSGLSTCRWRVRFAYTRWSAARRHVERVARADVLAGRTGADWVAAVDVPRRGDLTAWADALAYYDAAARGLADDLATGGQLPGAPVHGEPAPAPLRRDRPGR